MSLTPIETWSNIGYLLMPHYITGYGVKSTLNVLSTPKGVIIRRMRTGRDAALIPAPQDDLCLAFANTLAWRGSPMPSESLGGIEDLLRWLADTAKVTAESIEAARNRLRRHRNDAAGLFADAIALREAIYRTFSA